MSQINKTALAEITQTRIVLFYHENSRNLSNEYSRKRWKQKNYTRRPNNTLKLLKNNSKAKVRIQIFTAQVQISRFRSVYKSKNSCCRQNKDPLFLT